MAAAADDDAFSRAIAFYRARGPDRARQIDAMLADEDDNWQRIGRFAARSEQMDSLNLNPWATPPCRVAYLLFSFLTTA